MGTDLASVLWDVLDGYNFYKNFKTTAIGNDKRGLPQPVNRCLFFDEADSDDEHSSHMSDSSRQSQIKGNVNRWIDLLNFLAGLVLDIKESIRVSTNSTVFFSRKAFNQKCCLLSVLVLFISILLGLLELAITSNTISAFGGKERTALNDIEDRNWSVSSQKTSTSKKFNIFPISPERTDLSPSGENSSDISTSNSDFIPRRMSASRTEVGSTTDTVETCRQQIGHFSKTLQEREHAWAEQLEAQRRSIEALKQQISDLQKNIPGSQVLSEGSPHTENEILEKWKLDISGLVAETKSAITALNVEVGSRFKELTNRTSTTAIEIESKLTVITEEFENLRSSLNKKIGNLQNIVGTSGYQNGGTSVLTAEDVREVVRQETEMNKGEVNWITGVSAHSSTFKDSYFGLPMLVSMERAPEITVMKRNCWPMNGSQGFIQYELADKVLVQILTIEHLHKSRRLILGSVPKDFRVEGSPDKGITWLNLGSNTYDAEGPAVQHFNIEQTSEPLKTIKLLILSNYGEKYTCLYGVSVYGKRSA